MSDMTLHDIETTLYESPYQRLDTHPLSELTTSELVACLIGRSTVTKVEAQLLLSNFGTLRALSTATPKEIEGAGAAPRAATRIAVAMELARRLQAEPKRGTIRICNSLDVFDMLSSDLMYQHQEHMVALLLNVKGEVIRKEVISKGGLTTSSASAREVFAPAIRHGASALIIAHNHPSGDPTPSSADVDVTKQLKDAGKILGIQLIDHVVIAERGYYSFKEEGVI